MNNEWITICNQVVQGRQITVERYFEGGYRAKTISLKDYTGMIEQTDYGTIICGPAGAGYEIGWENDDLETLCREFKQHDFSETDVQQIYEICCKTA